MYSMHHMNLNQRPSVCIPCEEPITGTCLTFISQKHSNLKRQWGKAISNIKQRFTGGFGASSVAYIYSSLMKIAF